MRVLAITQLFPNSLQPSDAPFNFHQLSALAQLCELTLIVPIPFFPPARWLSPHTNAARLRPLPFHEQLGPLTVLHPRVPHLPVLGRPLAGPLYVASLLPWVWPMRSQLDSILGSWAYPDGMAATLLAHLLRLPCVVKLHGSDINVLASMPLLRPSIRWTLRHADGLVATSRALATKAIELGAPSDRLSVVLNGVDTTLFFPADRSQARTQLGYPAQGHWLLYVGRLDPAKGVLDLAEAFLQLAPSHPDCRLVLVGDGGAHSLCQSKLQPVIEQVVFAGSQPHSTIAKWMAACDLLLLPSWNEGTPNVLIESLACGRRVIATSVGGIPALITSPLLGALVQPHAPRQLASCIAQQLHQAYDPHQVASALNWQSWDQSAQRLLYAIERATQHYTASRGSNQPCARRPRD